MKRLLLFLILLSTPAYAETFKVEVPDEAVETIAKSWGYQDKIYVREDGKITAKAVNNPMSHSEYIHMRIVELLKARYSSLMIEKGKEKAKDELKDSQVLDDIKSASKE